MGRRHGTPQLRGRLLKYNVKGTVTCPPSIPERWFRLRIAKHETINVLGTGYELQNASPQWCFEQNGRCGMTGSGSRDTARCMDIMSKSVVTFPTNVASKGLKALEENEGTETPELLVREIKRFLRPGKRSESGAAASDKK